MRVEADVVKGTGMWPLVDVLLERAKPWQRQLPIQQIMSLKASEPGGVSTLPAALEERGIGARGGHALYLGPAEWKRSILADFAAGYPADAGLKVMRTPGPIARTRYTHPAKWESRLQELATYSHPHLILAANALYCAGLGPRLYDLVEVSYGSHSWPAYVVRHVEGRAPTSAEWRVGMRELKCLIESGRMSVIGGFDNGDFDDPTCGGNALVTPAGRFQYVDFQNFVLRNYGSILREEPRPRVPTRLDSTTPAPVELAKFISARAPALRRALSSVGCEIAGRRVIAVGPRAAGRIGVYLALGAAWCDAWDPLCDREHTEHALLALGCTRFTVVHREAELLSCGSQAQGAVLSYFDTQSLARRADLVQRSAWAFMLVGCGPDGSRDEALRTIHRLDARLAANVLDVAVMESQDGSPRHVAILSRRAA